MGRLKYPFDLLLAKGRAILAAQGGVAAVEFALLAPILLLVYFGSVDLSQGIEADRKLAYVTHTLGDLASQRTGEVSPADIEGLMGIADTVLRPFDSSRVSLRITVADVASDGSYSLYQPVTRGGEALACSSAVTIPESMTNLARGHSVIITEGCYTYRPAVGHVLETDVPLYKRNFHLPRAENFAYAGNASGGGGGSGGGGPGGGNGGGSDNGGGSGEAAAGPVAVITAVVATMVGAAAVAGTAAAAAVASSAE